MTQFNILDREDFFLPSLDIFPQAMFLHSLHSFLLL